MMIEIDVGCGGRGTRYPGFIGLDVWPKDGIHEDRGKDQYIERDVVKHGLPWDADQVDFAVCQHMLEHVTRPEALKIMQEIHRVLKPWAACVVSVPDLRLMAERWLAGDDEFYDKRYEPSDKPIWVGPTLTDKFLDSILGMGPHGHRYGYDAASLHCLCRESGFAVVERLRDDSPYHTRRDHSVALEITK